MSGLVAEVEEAPVSSWAGVGIAEDVEQIADGVRSGSWVDSGLGVVSVGLDALAVVSDPVGALLQFGVAWLIEHVKPLSEALDWLAGDAAQVTAHAQTWHNVAAELGAEADALAGAVRADLAEWSGSAADAYRDWAGHRVLVLRVLGWAAEAMAGMVEGAGMLVGTVRLMVRDAVATVVSRLIVYAVELVASAGLATPVVIEQVATLCANWAARIARWLHGLLASLRELGAAMKALGDRIARLAAQLRGHDDVPTGKNGADTSGSRRDGPRGGPDGADASGSADASSGDAGGQSGGEVRQPRGDVDFEVGWADEAYDAIRDTDDVERVAATARRYGFTEQDVREVKEHVFDREHLLDLYDDVPPTVERFSANPRMAEAWLRLREGTPHPEDLVLLEHERYEANFMAESGDPSYRRAHRAAEDAGWVWHPEAAAADGLGHQYS